MRVHFGYPRRLQESNYAKREIIGKEKVGGSFFVKKTNACQAITIEQRQQNLQSLSEGSFAQEVVTTSNWDAITVPGLAGGPEARLGAAGRRPDRSGDWDARHGAPETIGKEKVGEPSSSKKQMLARPSPLNEDNKICSRCYMKERLNVNKIRSCQQLIQRDLAALTSIFSWARTRM